MSKQDDQEWAELKAINYELEWLYAERTNSDGSFDLHVEDVIFRLEFKASKIIQARSDRTLGNIKRCLEEAMAKANDLLKDK